jgi:hypothetical protein
VAEPRSSPAFTFFDCVLNCLTAKERGGFNAGNDQDTKFDNPWRREGPLPDYQDSRNSRRRFDGPAPGDRPSHSVSEDVSDWRSSRPPRASEPEIPFKRKGSGFLAAESHTNTSDKDETWIIGGKFKPSPSDDPSGSKFGSLRRGEVRSTQDPTLAAEEGDWRSSARPRPSSQNSASRTRD